MALFKGRLVVRWNAEPGHWRWLARVSPRQDIWRVPQTTTLLVDDLGNFIVTDAGDFLEVV